MMDISLNSQAYLADLKWIVDLHENSKNCWRLSNKCWMAEIRHSFRYYEKLPDICSLSIEYTNCIKYITMKQEMYFMKIYSIERGNRNVLLVTTNTTNTTSGTNTTILQVVLQVVSTSYLQDPTQAVLTSYRLVRKLSWSI